MANYSDSFTYTNGALSGNAAWEDILGTGINVASNEINGIGANSISTVTTAQATFAADQEVEIELITVAGFDNIGVVARGTSGGNGYMAEYRHDELAVHLHEYTTNTKSASLGSYSVTLATTDKLKIRAVGTRISVQVDEGSGFVERISITDSNHASGQPGVFYSFQDSNVSRGDNFSATDELANGLLYTQVARQLLTVASGSRQLIDLSSFISVGTTGVCLWFDNTNNNTNDYGACHPDQTTIRVQDILNLGGGQLFVGVNADREVSIEIQAATVDVYLIGEFGSNATFLTQDVNKTPGSTSTWTTTAHAETTTATHAIYNAVTDAGNDAFTLGGTSGDSSATDVFIPNDTMSMIVPLNGSFESRLFVGGPKQVYLVGFVEDGMDTGDLRVDRSTATLGSYQTVAPSSGTPEYLLVLADSPNTSEITGDRFNLREPSSADIFDSRPVGNTIMLVKCNGSGEIEQQASIATQDLYIIGQITNANGVSPVTYTEDFNAISNGDLANEAEWENLVGNVVVITNEVYGGAALCATTITTASNTFADDQQAEVTIQGTPSNNDDAGAIIRGSFSTGLDAYYAIYEPVGPRVRLYKNVAGTQTQLGVSYNVTLTAGDKIRCKAVGTTISVEVDEGSGFVEQLSETDSDHTAGQPGIVYKFINTRATRADDFTATDNLNGDTTPDAFTFTDVIDQAVTTAIESNIITVTGIDASTAITVTAGEYRINGGAYTSAAGNVVVNDTVQLRITSSGSNSTLVSITCDIGGVTDQWDVTTIAGINISEQLFSAAAVPVNTETLDYVTMELWGGIAIDSGTLTTDASGNFTLSGLSVTAGSRWMAVKNQGNDDIATIFPVTVS